MRNSEFIELLMQSGFDCFITVPCTITAPLHRMLESQTTVQLLTTNHEHNLAGLAAGYYLATGKPAVIHMQNTGFPNALDGLLTCIKLYNIPVLLLTTWRGDTVEEKSLPHKLIGNITEALTSTLDFPMFGEPNGQDFKTVAAEACTRVRQGQAAILRIASTALDNEEITTEKNISPVSVPAQRKNFEKKSCSNRSEALAYIRSRHTAGATVFIYANGYTAREAFFTQQHENSFFNIGYMGGSLAIGYALAKHRPDISVVVVDGDQNAEMSCMKDHLLNDCPANLNYYIIDNGVGASVSNVRSIPLAPFYASIATIITIPVDTSSFTYERVDAREDLPALVQKLRSAIVK